VTPRRYALCVKIQGFIGIISKTHQKGSLVKIVMSNPAGTAPCSTDSSKQPQNRVDAFTDFINEWIDTNVKVFTKGGRNDSEVL